MSKPNHDVVHFGVREQLENGYLEHAVLEFDFKSFRLTKYTDANQNFTISFGELKQAQSDGNQIIVTFTNATITTARYIPFTKEDTEDLYGLFNIIQDNGHELLDASSSNIYDFCCSLQPIICMRKVLVNQKSFKRKGKKGGISKFVKKNPSRTQTNRSVGFLVLTNKNLLCFEDEKTLVPICLYPLGGIEIKKPSSETISISCSGDKAVFNIIQEGDEQILFYNAWRAATTVDIKQCKELRTIVNEIQSLFEGTFDKTSEEHIDWLRRLWDASNLGVSDTDGSPIEFKIQDNRWKDLGFQRDDPVSDLRATGLLGLQNLVYFAEQHPGLFLSMARNQQQSSEMEYPFATAGINITYLMITLLGLRKPSCWYPTVDTHPLFFHNAHAWEELYTIIFRLFDQKWNQMLVGYMGFQKVIDRTREDVGGLLRHKNPMTGEDDVPFIFEMLGILLNDLENFKTDTHRKQEMATHAFKERDGIPDKETPPTATSTVDEAAPESVSHPDIVVESHVAETPVTVASSDGGNTSVEAPELSLQAKDTVTNLGAIASKSAAEPNVSPRLNRISFSALPAPNNTWRTPTTPTGNSNARPRSVFSRRKSECSGKDTDDSGSLVSEDD